MKITKTQLKQIIKEELSETNPHEQLPSEYRKPDVETLANIILGEIEAKVVEGQPVPLGVVKTITDAAKRIRDAARGEY